MVDIAELASPSNQAMLKTVDSSLSTALVDFTPIELRRTKSADG